MTNSRDSHITGIRCVLRSATRVARWWTKNGDGIWRSACAPPLKGGNRAADVRWFPHFVGLQLNPQDFCRVLGCAHGAGLVVSALVPQYCDTRELGDGLLEKFELLGAERRGIEGVSRHIPARPSEAGDESSLHRTVHDHRHDGNAGRSLLGGANDRGSPGGHQDVHWERNQLSRERGQAVLTSPCPAGLGS